MSRKSEGEMLMKILMDEAGFTTVPEHKFCETRKWRFDFAILDKKIGIEIEGGTFSRGRHTRPLGFRNDCEKYNMATALGWRVYRFPTDWVQDMTAINFLKEHL